MALPTSRDVSLLLADLTSAVNAYSNAENLDGYLSRVEIIGKAKELIRSLTTPEQIPNYHGLNMAEVVAIRTFIRLGVLEAIPRDRSISLDELAEKTGVQDSLLERMSRILVATGFLNQTRTDGGDYCHTKFSLSYLLDRPGPGHLFLAMYDEWFKNMVDFDDYLVARGLIGSVREPDDPLHNPYTAKHNQEGTPVWAIMAQDPEKIQAFQTGMAGLDVVIPAVGHFDFESLRNTPEEAESGIVELVDVGGGHGVVLSQILAAHSGLTSQSCMLQDRPDVIAMAKKRSVLPADVQYLAHDFLTEQPVKGAKAYFMRMILHDYSDSVGIQVLAQLAQSMSPESRVLVCEMVLPPRVGEADFAAAVLDQAVMTMGGKERTEQGFRKMFEAAGLELFQVWRVPGAPGACVEGRLRAQ